jgi:hydrogenase maturation protease
MAMDPRPREMVVLGLGNPMRTDDAVGVQAVGLLAQDKRLPAGVRLVEGGTLGLELLYHVENATHLLVLDAVEANESPATLMLFRDEALEALPCGRSIHLLGLADLLSALRLTGRAPDEVMLLGIQPAHTGWGTELTAEVQTVMPRLIDKALEQLAAWQTAALPPCALDAANGTLIPTGTD